VEIVTRALYGKEFDDLLHGKIPERIFWQSIRERNGWDISLGELEALARAGFTEIEGTRDIIFQLQGNYTLGLLSNHAKEWINYCEKRFAYHSLFTACLYSFEVGIGKPQKSIYNLLLKRIGEKPENCLFIDDMEKNVLAAQELGFTTIQFTTSAALHSELRKLQIMLC
jgi:putative hydrolase of the HAD superfamily